MSALPVPTHCSVLKPYTDLISLTTALWISPGYNSVSHGIKPVGSEKLTGLFLQ